MGILKNLKGVLQGVDVELLQGRIQILETRVRGLILSKNAARKHIQDQTEQIERLKNENNQLQDNISNLINDKKSLREEVDLKTNCLNAARQNLATARRLKTIGENKLIQAEQQIQTLADSVEESKNKSLACYNKLNEEKTAIERIYQQKCEDYDGLNQRTNDCIAELTNQKNIILDNVAVLSNEKTQLQESLTHSISEKERAEQTIIELRRELDQQENESLVLSQKLEKMQKVARKVYDRLKEKNEKHAALAKEHQVLQAELKGQTDDNKVLNETKDELAQQLKGYKDNVQSLQETCERLKQENAAMTEEKEKIFSDYQSLLEEKENLQPYMYLVEEKRKDEALEMLKSILIHAQEVGDSFVHPSLADELTVIINHYDEDLENSDLSVEKINEYADSLSGQLQSFQQKETVLLEEDEKARQEAEKARIEAEKVLAEKRNELMQKVKESITLCNESVSLDAQEQVKHALDECNDLLSSDTLTLDEVTDAYERFSQTLSSAEEIEKEERSRTEEIEEDEDHVVKRTILEIWDNQEGDIIKADEFFSRSENELIRWRRIFEESILYNERRFLCPYCKQPVKISGRKFKRGEVSFFSHLHDSEFCEIKTTSGFTKEQIEARKYGLVCESDRHKRLKALISRALQGTVSYEKGVSDVEVEKRVDSDIPYLNWRRPDVMARFKEMNLVFELQLSTTFISVVVQRDIFYRLNDYFIIWVFNFDENKKFVDLTNLMCKDIYYANKRNIFVFDQEAQQVSIERDELVLKVNWLDVDSTWHYSVDKNGKDGELITLDQLKYDVESSKPYYYDAETPYFELYPDAKERLLKEEKSKEEMLNSLRERQTREQEESEARLERARVKMMESGDSIVPKNKDGKWGFVYDNAWIVQAQYTAYEVLDDQKMYKVKKGRHWGLIDFVGNKLFSVSYLNFHSVGQGLVIGENASAFYISDQCKISERFPHDTISIQKMSSRVYRFVRNETALHVFVIDGSVLLIKKENESYMKFVSFDGETQKEDSYIKYKFTDDFLAIWVQNREDSDWSLIELDGTVISPCLYSNLYRSEGCMIALHKEGTDFYNFNGGLLKRIPYMCSRFIESMPVIHNEGLYGLLNEDFELVLAPDFSYITILDTVVCAQQNGLYGLFDKTGRQLTEVIYSSVKKLRNGYLAVCLQDSYGLLSVDGSLLLDCEYSSIKDAGNDANLICTREGKSYLFYLKDNCLSETSYDTISRLDNNSLKVVDGNACGLIDPKGNTLISMGYVEIDHIAPANDYFKTNYVKDLYCCYNSEKLCCAYSISKQTVVIPAAYTAIYWISDDFFSVADKNTRQGVYRLGVGLITEMEYNNIGVKEEGRIAVWNLSHRKGYVDLTGKKLITDVRELSNGFFTKEFFSQWGVFDKDGQVILPYQSSKMIEYLGHGLYKIVEDGKCGVKNDSDDYVLRPAFNEVYTRSDTKFLLAEEKRIESERGYQYGYYRTENVSKFSYKLYQLDGTQTNLPDWLRTSHDFMRFCARNVVMVGKKMLSLNTFEMTDECVENIVPFEDTDYFLVTNTAYKHGLYDKNLQVIIPCLFWSIERWGHDLFLVKCDRDVNLGYSATNMSGLSGEQEETMAYKLLHLDGSECEVGEFSSIGKLENNRAAVVKFGNIGYLDQDGNIIFDESESLSEHLIVNKGVGLIAVRDKNSKVVLPFSAGIKTIDQLKEHYYLFADGLNKGVLKDDGNVVIPCIYPKIIPWTDDLLVVEVQGALPRSFSLMTYEGEAITSERYDSIDELIEGRAVAYRAGKKGLINGKGEGICDEEVRLDDMVIVGKMFEKWGMTTIEGKILLSYIYTSITQCDDKRVMLCETDNFGRASNYLYDYENRRLLSTPIKDVVALNGGYTIITSPLGMVGLYNREFVPIIPFSANFSRMTQWNENLVLAHKKQQPLYKAFDILLNFQGKVVSERNYDSIGQLVAGKAEAVMNGVSGFIDTEGQEMNELSESKGKWSVFRKFGVYEVFYEKEQVLTQLEEAYFFTDSILVVKSKGKHYLKFYYTLTRTLSENQYIKIGPCVDGRAKATDMDSLSGWLDENGQKIYDKSDVITKDFTYRRKFSRYELLQGEQIILSDLLDVSLWSDNILKVKSSPYEYRLFSLDTLTYLGDSYTHIDDLKDGRAAVAINRNNGFIDASGNVVAEDELQLDKQYVKFKKLGFMSIQHESLGEIFRKECDEVCTYRGGLIVFEGYKTSYDKRKVDCVIPAMACFQQLSTRSLVYKVGNHKVFLKKGSFHTGDQSMNDFIDGHKKMLILIVHRSKQGKLYGIPYEKANDKVFSIGEEVKAVVKKILPYGINVDVSKRYSLIHKSRLTAMGINVEQFSVGQQIKLRKDGYDVEHNNELWTILDNVEAPLNDSKDQESDVDNAQTNIEGESSNLDDTIISKKE